MSETGRTNNNIGWNPDGAISGKVMNCAARLRELADKLPSDLRVEANEIASDVAAEALRVNGLEEMAIN